MIDDVYGDLGECQWFLRCRNEAVMLEPHPILVEVPICQRCHDWCERMAR
jgi:hypothetical protein